MLTSVIVKLIEDSGDRDSGEHVGVGLRNYCNWNYVGKIHVGNPPQEVRTIFDTGSTNIWILSSLCHSDGILKGDNEFFTPSSSASFVQTEKACEV